MEDGGEENPNEWPAVSKVVHDCQIYYQNKFPITTTLAWLAYGLRGKELANREFTFINAWGKWYRFQFIKHPSDLMNALKILSPIKIDLGPVYKIPRTRTDTRKTAAANFRNRDEKRAVKHELVFDIDIDVYDDVRSCCQGPQICQECWKFMAIACEIMERTLREDLQLKHILWTFSGRRGIHAWVCDESVRSSSSNQRLKILNAIQKVKSPKDWFNVNFSTDLPHPIKRALNIIKPHFVDIVEKQGLLTTHIDIFMKLLPGAIRTAVEIIFKSCTTPLQKWKVFVAFIQYLNTKAKEKCFLVEMFMLYTCYPKIDGGVSMQINHLLGAPFSVHAKTEKIGIAFDPKKVWHFDLAKVPTVHSLTVQLSDRTPEDNMMVLFYQNAIEVFELFVKEMVVARKRQKAEKIEDQENSTVNSERTQALSITNKTRGSLCLVGRPSTRTPPEEDVRTPGVPKNSAEHAVLELRALRMKFIPKLTTMFPPSKIHPKYRSVNCIKTPTTTPSMIPSIKYSVISEAPPVASPSSSKLATEKIIRLREISRKALAIPKPPPVSASSSTRATDKMIKLQKISKNLENPKNKSHSKLTTPSPQEIPTSPPTRMSPVTKKRSSSEITGFAEISKKFKTEKDESVSRKWSADKIIRLRGIQKLTLGKSTVVRPKEIPTPQI
uniref:DNA primase n=1 Tax=Fopius arisanus TaxID=64838 RepID=A0A0C9QEF0_9HYME